jgi:hypothetical protein
LAATGGVNDFYGRITNMFNGQIAVTNQSVMIFHDDVTAQAGTITVFPGSSAVFLEDLTMSPGATLLADLAGTDDDTGFGQIEVVGNALLSGSLAVTLAGDFTPQVGDTFPLVTAGGIGGSLSLGAMPGLPDGLAWSLGGDEHRVVLSVVPALAGDYNVDGRVNAADYVLWRRAANQSGAGLAADGNQSGAVTGADYDFWRSHYGNAAAAGASLAAIPEPGSVLSLLIGLSIAPLVRPLKQNARRSASIGVWYNKTS